MFVCTVCTDLLFESYKTAVTEFNQKWKFSDYLLNPMPEMFCGTTKHHLTFHQDEGEKVMTGFSFLGELNIKMA